MRANKTQSVFLLIVLLVSIVPTGIVDAVTVKAPPADFFQLPWEQGVAWVAIDGLDNGTKRPLSSSHHYTVGGAIDFAPHPRMVKGEDTSNAWVAAAGGGTVISVSKCHVIIDHHNGWITQYQFLGNVQVNLGDDVERNQRLGIIADGYRYKFCLGSVDPDVPHLHFMLRPTMVDATFAGWHVNYDPYFSSTTFTKNGKTVGLNTPLLNTFDDIFTPTPPPTEITPTPIGAYTSTTSDKTTIDIGEKALITVRLNNVPAEGYTSAEVTCTYPSDIILAGNIVVGSLFGEDPAIAINDPQNGAFIVAIAGSHGNKATTSGILFTFNVTGLQAGQASIVCKTRVSSGNNILVELPSVGTTLSVLGSDSTPTNTPPMPSTTPTATPTVPNDDWFTYRNLHYGFLFRYPPQGQFVDGATNNYARLNLPFTSGTNLSEKYLEMMVVETTDICQSPLSSSSILTSSETIVINGLTFLKQTGGDGAAGSLYQWEAYSVSKNGICVSLDFILHSLNPGNFENPPPVFDYNVESAVFLQVAETFTWLDISPTETLVPNEATLFGKVVTNKTYLVGLYDASQNQVAANSYEAGDSFTFVLPPGSYTIVVQAEGYLEALGSFTLNPGATLTLPDLILPAGDIDANHVIDQFDAITIGMNYNLAAPPAADLNNDGTINVLDLELLAGNYRKTGPVSWE